MNEQSNQHLSMLKFMVFSIVSALALVFGSAIVWAEAAKPISGNYTAIYSMQKALPVSGAKGHVLMLAETHGLYVPDITKSEGKGGAV